MKMRMVASYTRLPPLYHYSALSQLTIRITREELRKRAIVSLNATDVFKSVYVSCLSNDVKYLIIYRSTILTSTMEIDANADIVWAKLYSLKLFVLPFFSCSSM